MVDRPAPHEQQEVQARHRAGTAMVVDPAIASGRDNTDRSGLGPFQLFTLLFGSIIGAGWIVATGLWIGSAGPIGAVAAFGLGASIMLLIGLCFAELMAMFPNANGSMAYIFEAFGARAAAVAGWCMVLTYSATCAWYFVIGAWLITVLLPMLTGPVVVRLAGGEAHLGDLAIGLAAAVLIATINIRGVRSRARFQDGLVILKILLGILLIGLGFYYGSPGRLDPMFAGAGSDAKLAGVASVALMTPFFFAGFDVLPQAIRDRRDQAALRRIGWIIFAATGAAFLFYAGVIVAASMALERSALTVSSLPVLDAFRNGLGMPWLATVAVVAGLSGVLSGWNASMLAGSRILQGLARSAAVPRVFAGEMGTARSIWTVTAISVVLGLLGRRGLGSILDVVTLPLIVVFALVCATVLRLRIVAPAIARPYRVPGGRWLIGLALILSIGLIVLSVRGAFAAVGSALPLLVCLLWAITGLLLWSMAARRRGAMPALQRKLSILQ